MILEDLDSDANTITIETDRFSTYAIVYQDMAKADSNDSVQNTGNTGDSVSPKENEPKTEDSAQTKIRIYATLAMVSGFGYLALYFADESHGMTEEEKTVSGGSDFHGANKPGLLFGTGYGKLYIHEEVLDRLKALLPPSG